MSEKRNFMTELVELVPPPHEPIEAKDTGQWNAVQKELGITLPSDLLELSITYGRGCFTHPSGDASFEVLHPLSRRYKRRVTDMQKTLRWCRSSYDIFPKSPGLLCSGVDAFQDRFCWLTQGNPDSWPVIFITADFKQIHYDTSLTGFLVQLFSGQVEDFGAVTTGDWFRERTGEFIFEPGRPDRSSRWPPLMEAIVMLDRPKARRLLKEGVDPNTPLPGGSPPLFAAIENASDEELVQILLAAGADPNLPGEEGRTALQLAAWSDYTPNCVELLLAAGADVSTKDDNGWTPLLWACTRQFEDRVRLLLENGADPNDRLPDGRTALQLARGSSAICEMLKAAGATE